MSTVRMKFEDALKLIVRSAEMGNIENSLAIVGSLTAQVEPLVEDRLRMDWLEANLGTVHIIRGKDATHLWGHGRVFSRPTTREAIDAAMKETR